MKNLITSSGVIKNREVPRVGVISLNSELLDSDCKYDLIDPNNCIDLSYDEYMAEQNELHEAGEIDFDELESNLENYENDCSTYLIGSWTKDADGKYSVNKNGEFAASFSTDSNCISVEWSKTTRRCHHTSPCYVMADGSGPCGDLDTEGDAVVAFDLPAKYYQGGE